jgi:hypothetical protein
MNIPRLALGTALLAACVALAGHAGTAFGQGGSRVEDPVFAAPGWTPAQSQNPAGAVRRPVRAVEPNALPTQNAPQTARAWVSPRRPGGAAAVRAASAETPVGAVGDQPETIPTPAPLSSDRVPNKPMLTQPLGPASPREVQPGRMTMEPVPGIPETYGPDYGVNDGNGPSGGCGCDSCGEGGQCGDCDDEDECVCGMHRLGVARLLGNMSLFVGTQGFKGPVDSGQNGNFGFHAGLNFGGPVGDPWCTGYQLGFQGVESNFTGSLADGGSSHGREQAFVTAGLFHRATCGGGLQGGVAFDYLHDSYYVKTDLKQIRSETSLLFGSGHEVGYWGAYGVSKQRFQLFANAPAGATAVFQPTDIFAAFYRKTAPSGGQGRIWLGATGGGEGIIGAELTIPLGSTVALENSFTYMIPKHGANSGGQLEEGWTLAIQLVWYPGRPASCALQDPYRPLFGVGDNTTFMVRR